MGTEKIYDYEKHLLIEGHIPSKTIVLSKDKNTPTTVTITVLAECSNGKEWLFRFFYWCLPRHGVSEEIRLNSFRMNQLI